MIRLPVTGIDISQNDVAFHLHQIDIYQGLLKQGFKKQHIVQYFRDKDSQYKKRTEVELPDIGPVPSSFTLSSLRLQAPCSNHDAVPAVSSNGTSYGGRQQSSPQPASPDPDPIVEPLAIPHDKAHAPRKSSLLRFAQVLSSEVSPELESTANLSFSPRSNMTYRPRTDTYSYDQSSISEEGPDKSGQHVLEDLEFLSIDDDIVPDSLTSTDPSRRAFSTLRPDAESFRPAHVHSPRPSNSSMLHDSNNSYSNSSSRFIPSSPPTVQWMSGDFNEASSPSLSPIPPLTPKTEPRNLSDSARRHITQAFLDGTFAVYDDMVPAQFQPQTPADLRRHQEIDTYSAAYTAPPGTMRPQSNRAEQPSGGISPTTRAALTRQRRQREHARSARVRDQYEDWAGEVRHGRSADTDMTSNRDIRRDRHVYLWQDNFELDSVGEENFENGSFAAEPRNIRAVSGNRRLQ